MIKAQEYLKMLEINREVIVEQSEGMTDSEMLIQPPNGGNCMLWTLGHLANNLVSILSLLGEEKTEKLAKLDRFGYGSEPVLGPEPNLMTKAELMEVYDLAHGMVAEKIAPLTDADFNKEVVSFKGPTRLGWMLFFLEFHHAYHVGQLELLRNLAGYTEKIT